MKIHNRGFTLVEVILFLALSSLFLLIALNGVGSRSGGVQFSDSIRSLEAYLETEFNMIFNGANPSPTATGTDEGVIFLGKMFRLLPNQQYLEAYTIVGDRLDTDAFPNDSVSQIIWEANPRRADPTAAARYDFEWGSMLRNSLSDSSGNPPVGYFGFLRNPVGLDIIVVTLDGSPGGPAILDDPDTYSPTAYNYPNDVHLCIEGGNGQEAEVAIGAATRELEIEANFDAQIIAGCFP